MKLAWTITTAIILSAFLIGCSGTSPSPPDSETLVTDECKSPEWARQQKTEKDNEKEYYHGLGQKALSKRDSRDSAKRDAVRQYIESVGLEVNLFNSYLSETYGSTGEVLSSDLESKEKLIERAEALIKGIRIGSSCTITKEQIKQGSRKTVYEVEVVVTVPISERARIDQYRSANITYLYKKAEKEYNSALEAEGNGNVMLALNYLFLAGISLDEAKKVITTGTSFGQTVDNGEIISLENKIVSGLTPSISSDGEEVVKGQKPQSINLEMNYNSGKSSQSVSGFPFKIESSGAMLGRAFTNNEGKADFTLEAIEKKGKYEFTILADEEALRDKVSANVYKTLLANRLKYMMNVVEPDMNYYAKRIVHGLANRLAEKKPGDGPFGKVAVGSYLYGESEAAGSFSKRFGLLLESALANNNQSFSNVPLPILDNSGGDIFSKDGAPDFLLEGNYFEEGDRVTVNSFLRSKSGKEVGYVTKLNKSEIPPDWEFYPQNIASFIQDNEAVSGQDQNGFNIELWMEKPPGSVYELGEKVVIKFRSDIDCFLTLINVDSSGRKLVIFPNDFEPNGKIFAGKTYSLGGVDDDFDFEVSEPVGAERVIALASTKPFPKLNGDDLGSGIIQYRGSLKNLLTQTRSILPSAKKAEASLTFTTTK